MCLQCWRCINSSIPHGIKIGSNSVPPSLFQATEGHDNTSPPFLLSYLHMQFIKLLLETIFTFLALDALWITQVASPWMKKAVPHLMASSPNWAAAIAFYVIYLSIILYLIVMPAISSRLGYQDLALRSFLFGFACYATYDLTNLAVMKGFPIGMAVADMVWGGIVTMATALIIYRLNI